MTDDRLDEPRLRPFISMNVAESADGKISPVGHGKVTFGSSEDRAQMELLRGEADGVLIGSGTLLVEDPPIIIRDPQVSARRLGLKGAPHPLNITVCSTLTLGLSKVSSRCKPSAFIWL